MKERTQWKSASAGLLRMSVAALCAAQLAGCSKSMEVKSHWCDRQVTIDGKSDEWTGVLTPLEDQQTQVGVMNDSEYVYLAMVTSNRDLQRQVLWQGVTFWFDRKGGDDKTFGIRYPLSAPRFNRPQEGVGGDEAEANDRDQIRVENSSTEMEIYGPGEKEQRRVSLAEAAGVQAKFHTENNILVYELRVPMADIGPHIYAIGTKPGELIGVGAETMSNRGGERPSGGREGGEGGMGGGGGRRGGGGYGGGGRGGRGGMGGGYSSPGKQAEPLKVWAKVQLASTTSQTK